MSLSTTLSPEVARCGASATGGIFSSSPPTASRRFTVLTVGGPSSTRRFEDGTGEGGNGGAGHGGAGPAGGAGDLGAGAATSARRRNSDLCCARSMSFSASNDRRSPADACVGSIVSAGKPRSTGSVYVGAHRSDAIIVSRGVTRSGVSAPPKLAARTLSQSDRVSRVGSGNKRESPILCRSPSTRTDPTCISRHQMHRRVFATKRGEASSSCICGTGVWSDASRAAVRAAPMSNTITAQWVGRKSSKETPRAPCCSTRARFSSFTASGQRARRAMCSSRMAYRLPPSKRWHGVGDMVPRARG